MKKILTICLAVCLLALSIPGYAATEGEVLGVTNCKSWISLRVAPNTAVRRLARVPKGALVTYGSDSGNGFAYKHFKQTIDNHRLLNHSGHNM